jgi:tetratricopeptide (TPR) repeat protein
MSEAPAQKRKVVKNTAFLVISVGIVILLFLSSFNFHLYLSSDRQKNKVLGEKTSLEEEKSFWVNFLTKNPNYLPGIIELAKIEWKLGNKEKALKLTKKARSINPDIELLDF